MSNKAQYFVHFLYGNSAESRNPLKTQDYGYLIRIGESGTRRHFTQFPYFIFCLFLFFPTGIAHVRKRGVELVLRWSTWEIPLTQKVDSY